MGGRGGGKRSQEFINFISIFLSFQTEKTEPCDMGLVGRYAVLGSTIYPVGLYYW